MTTTDSNRYPAPHPLDPDPLDSPTDSVSYSLERDHLHRYPRIETGRSFPLSLLVFLFTIACIFFAVWRVSSEGAIAVLCLISPGLIYTMWVVEQRRLNGEATPFIEQAYMWGKSTAILGSCLLIFSVTFTLAYAFSIMGFYVGAKLILGESAGSDGVVMGSIVALPIACYGSIFAVYGLIRITWGRPLVDPVDVRN